MHESAASNPRHDARGVAPKRAAFYQTDYQMGDHRQHPGPLEAMSHIEIVETRDGSKTLYDHDKKVHYRSIWGAQRESRYVFLEGSGLVDKPCPWRVLELGFGAAVNFTQTALACLERDGCRLEYHSVEYAPVAPDKLSFHEGPVGDLARRAVEMARDTGEPALVEGFEGRVRLHLYPQRWVDFDRPDLRADAVYYDPFGPRSEPDSWTRDCFAIARRHMAEHGVLATYSAATAVKRAMFEAELHVASAPGPGRKREVTFAARAPDAFAERDGVELLSRQRYLDRNDDA